MLTDDEMLHTVALKDMWLDFYVVIQNSDYSVVSLEDAKPYVTLRTGQIIDTDSK